ncbi:DMT family transporter [Lysinibacter cavernae]|uniref:Drug/metabolite transporter (DMT)-like permease n=1 Tax=Lysinibacter cavernae TaxID=1640652 RepID=A0A7X5QZU1_9MICO|nr:DMT family transporter [Lysinibacter cavernae]NIH52917.1 drug/metabolite transporter (DMT)-like permease [Lysinibacter cavernae]
MIFALMSAISHAAWNTVAKRGAGAGLPLLWVSNLIAIGALLPIAVTVLALHDAEPHWDWLLAGAVGALLHTAYSVLLQRGYSVADAAFVYPVSRGIAPVLVAFAGLALWQQPLSLTGWAGIACVSLAAVGLVGGGLRAAEVLARQVAVTLALGGAIAAYTLWDAWVVVTLGVDPLAYYVVLGALQTAVLSVLVRRRMREGLRSARAHPVITVSLAVLVPASYLFALVALGTTPVAVVAAIRSSSIVLASAAAVVFLGERLTVTRCASGVLAAVGVAMLAIGSRP